MALSIVGTVDLKYTLTGLRKVRKNYAKTVCL